MSPSASDVLHPAALPSVPRTTGPAAAGSCYADRSAARMAIELALPMLRQAAMQPDVCGSGFISIVVMDPGLQPGDAPFEEAILFEHDVGDRSRWDADYQAFARGKARATWERGEDGTTLLHQRPHALREGDTLIPGGVMLDGIVVAVSGCHTWYDEAFASSIAANLRAIARQRCARAAADRQLTATPPPR